MKANTKTNNTLLQNTRCLEKRLAALFTLLQAHGNRWLANDDGEDASVYTAEQEKILREVTQCLADYETLKSQFEEKFPGQTAVLEAQAMACVTAVYPTAYQNALTAVDGEWSNRLAAAPRQESMNNKSAWKVCSSVAKYSAITGAMGVVPSIMLLIASLTALAIGMSVCGGVLIGVPLLMLATYGIVKAVNHHVASSASRDHDQAIRQTKKVWDNPSDQAKIGFFHCKQQLAGEDFRALNSRATSLAA